MRNIWRITDSLQLRGGRKANEQMSNIKKEADSVKDATDAAKTANDAAENVQDGKTPFWHPLTPNQALLHLEVLLMTELTS